MPEGVFVWRTASSVADPSKDLKHPTRNWVNARHATLSLQATLYPLGPLSTYVVECSECSASKLDLLNVSYGLGEYPPI